MNIIEKLKKLGVDVTPEIEKALSGEWVSQLEVERKQEKIKELTDEISGLKETQDTLEKELKELKDNAPDLKSYQDKIDELTSTLEQERDERKKKDEEARLVELVTDFFKDKVFVNDITKEAIKSQLVSSLNSDAARGKSIADLFNAIVNDEDGNVRPNILVTEEELELQKKRSGIVKPNFTPKPGAKLTTAEIMKLKNQYPDMDISPYLKK